MHKNEELDSYKDGLATGALIPLVLLVIFFLIAWSWDYQLELGISRIEKMIRVEKIEELKK